MNSARQELGGSIAKNHDELVVLQKRGERNYYEFDLAKSKQFQREGPIEISLRKANQKNQYADLQLIVEDRKLIQKHVNAYQPVWFYSDKEQPIEVVINEVRQLRLPIFRRAHVSVNMVLRKTKSVDFPIEVLVVYDPLQ